MSSLEDTGKSALRRFEDGGAEMLPDSDVVDGMEEVIDGSDFEGVSRR